MTLDYTAQPSLNERFSEQGFVHVPSLGVDTAELTRARVVLDQLFDRFVDVPKQFAHDLAGGADPAKPILPEINAVSTLAPELRRTGLFRAAQTLARQLLGPDAYVIYDHAIYKPPGLAGTTSWHQDSGYDAERTNRLAIWIPFQDTSVEDGAMRYVPRSHLGGRQQHLERTTADGKTVQYLQVDEATVVEAPCLLGGATAHDFHMVHGAGPNLGVNTRKAWILDFTTGSRAERAIEAAKEKVRVRRYRVL
jgi:ectoine hydroxylase-related dioxygenase (phytanoyl-CoA dioxygenase family)